MNKLWWVIIGLMALIVGMILFDRDPEPVSTQKWKDQISAQNLKIVTLKADSAKLSQKVAQDSVSQANEKIAHHTAIKKKDAVIANLRANPVVVKVREETPEVDNLLTAMEAKDSIQTERIAVLENDNEELRVDMNAMKDNFGAMLQAERTKFEASQSMNKDLEKALKKSKRGAKLAKILVPVVGAGMLLLGAQL